jgi:hypothetical protein
VSGAGEPDASGTDAEGFGGAVAGGATKVPFWHLERKLSEFMASYPPLLSCYIRP